MRHDRKYRHAFRPSIEGASLEERLVMAAPLRIPLSTLLQNFAIASAAAQRANVASQGVTVAQVRRAFNQQIRSTQTTLRQQIATQAAQIFNSGTPTAQQMTDFNQFVNGATNAAAFRLSSLAAILPGASSRLIPAIQNNLLSSTGNGLLGRLQTATLNNGEVVTARSLQNSIGRAVNRSFSSSLAQSANFFGTNNIQNASVDALGQPIPLQQFLGQRVISQFANSLGSLSSAFNTVAGTSLFSDPSPAPTIEARQAFANQFGQAFNTVTAQLGTNLSLFPNSSSLISDLQSSFFGSTTGTNTVSNLFGGLSGLPDTSTDFNSLASTSFENAFQSAATPLSNFFSGSTFNRNLPTSNFTNVFGSTFTNQNFAGGFNNGFGSGFIGFGSSPSSFNSNFNTGFNNSISNLNSSFGFNNPNFSFSNGAGTSFPGSPTPGNGTGTGTGTGTGGTSFPGSPTPAT